MAEAPDAVVRRVQEALGCQRVDATGQRPVEVDGFVILGKTGCITHRDRYGLPQSTDRGCPVAVDAADAAFTASLEWAAERLPAHTEGSKREGTARWPERDRDIYSAAIEDGQAWLRLAGEGS